MGKYTNLVKNILIFAIGTMLSKLMVFLMMPLYTRYLTPEQSGIIGILIPTANIIIPVAFLCIQDAVTRFGLDKNYKKTDILNVGLRVIFFGFIASFLLLPILMNIDGLKEYLVLIYAFILCSILNQTVMQFARTSGYIKIFAGAGVVNTATMIILNIIFLTGFNLGVTGYISAIFLADLVTATFVFIVTKQWRFIHFSKTKKGVMKTMLLYSIPLMPNALSWWITNASDRYFITYMLSTEINGLYEYAYRIPTLITLISSVFMQAWLLSAVGESSPEEKSRFYSVVFNSYQSLLFIAAGFVMLLIKPIISMLDSSYHDAWRFVPILLLAAVFQCFSAFYGSVYIVAKKTKSIMLTTLIGAAANLLLNAFLIPGYGANGAAFATFISFLLVYLLRAIWAEKFIAVNNNVPVMYINMLLIGLQTVIMLFEVPLWWLWATILFILIAILNVKPVLKSIYKLLDERRKKDAAVGEILD